MTLREKVLRDFDAYVSELDRREEKVLRLKKEKIFNQIAEIEKLVKKTPELHDSIPLLETIKSYVQRHAFLPESYKLTLSLIVAEYCKLKKINVKELEEA